MKFSSLVLSAALAVASSASFAGGGPLDLSSGSAGFSATPISGSFTDTYTFTLASSELVSSSITTMVNGPRNIDFSSITLSGLAGPISFSQVLGDPTEVWALPSTVIAAGSYTLTLSGTNSPAGASYGGNISVTPVPEPETYALLAAGLGIIGFVTRRRKA